MFKRFNMSPNTYRVQIKITITLFRKIYSNDKFVSFKKYTITETIHMSAPFY